MKNPHAQALGRLGGKAGRGASKARSKEHYQKAQLARWAKHHLLKAGRPQPETRGADDIAYRALMNGETHL